MDFTRRGTVGPHKIIRVIQESGAVQLFGSPALLDRVGRLGEARGSACRASSGCSRLVPRCRPGSWRRFSRLLGPGAKSTRPMEPRRPCPSALWRKRDPLGNRGQVALRRGHLRGASVPGMEVRLIRISGPSRSGRTPCSSRKGGGRGSWRGRPVVAEYFRRRRPPLWPNRGPREKSSTAWATWAV